MCTETLLKCTALSKKIFTWHRLIWELNNKDKKLDINFPLLFYYNFALPYFKICERDRSELVGVSHLYKIGD